MNKNPQPEVLRRRCLKLSISISLAMAASSSLAADIPVSPGDLVDIPPATSACPTFSWSSDSSSGVELVVALYSNPDETILQQELPAGASSWTPPANRCLPPGQYVWFLRELGSEITEWSDTLGFEVSSAPTLEEVERARDVLERFISSGGETANSYAATNSFQAGQINNARTQTSSGGKGVPGREGQGIASARSSGNNTVQITGSQGLTVSSAAMTGISDSAAAAGVLASNSAGGADLVLDGPVQGQLKENEWQLDSASAQTFDFTNPSGDLTVRVNGNPLLTSASAGAGEPVSMFGAFGGNGTVDKTIVGDETFNGAIAYYKNLTIPAGTTWTTTRPVVFIAVSGTCDIAGEIITVKAGHDGGRAMTASGPSPGAPGWSAAGAGSGYGMHGGMHRVPVPMAISGAGGGGGGTGDAPLQRGGDGGGAEAFGGEGGYPEFGAFEGRDASVDWDKRFLMTGGAANDTLFPPGALLTDFFINFLYFPGAGGGAGAVGAGGGTGGKGGDGGGNIYLECRKASFTGEINVRGESGADGSGNAGGGGGGGGGIAVIRTLELLQNSGSTQVLGGVGGDPGNGGGGPGGNGRMGMIEIVDL